MWTGCKPGAFQNLATRPSFEQLVAAKIGGETPYKPFFLAGKGGGYLCLHSGGIVAHQTAADALGVAIPTVTNHLLLLEQANLIYRLPPMELGGKKILKAKNKCYLADAALRNAVLLRGEEVLSSPEEMGTIVETTVFRHLFAYYYRDTPEVRYWRDAKSDKEVDIVVRSPRYQIAVEVKYRGDARIDASDGLAIFAKGEPDTKAYFASAHDLRERLWACAAAGRWTNARAAEWWATHRHQLRSGSAASPAAADTRPTHLTVTRIAS